LDAQHDDPQGQAMLTGLMAAYSSGKNIVVEGTGTCGGWGGEAVLYFYTVD
jgi:hypothetical protein